MKHRLKGKKLNRTSSHRKALLKNLNPPTLPEKLVLVAAKSSELSRCLIDVESLCSRLIEPIRIKLPEALLVEFIEFKTLLPESSKNLLVEYIFSVSAKPTLPARK